MSAKPPCSISVDVLTTADKTITQATQEALEEALMTNEGVKFKRGDCQELIVLFRSSVGP